MLFATLLALTAAVLHAGWNLIAKRSADPFLALWGQFLVAGLIGAAALVVTGGLPSGVWVWAFGSGLAHVPYVLGLASAYRHGDFSLAYPIARGGGALVAGIGGLVVLGDELRPLAVAAIVVVVAGMALLAAGAARAQVRAALVVAASIGVYTLFDSHAAREFATFRYVFASLVATAVTASITGLALGRGRDLLTQRRPDWLRTCGAAVMTMTAYGLVLVAVRHAPVGYVAALRESSVLLAVIVGARYLDEGSVRRRFIAAAVIVTGLVALVAAG